MLKRKEVGKYGESHYGVLNDWKPTAKPTTNGYESNTNLLQFFTSLTKTHIKHIYNMYNKIKQ